MEDGLETLVLKSSKGHLRTHNQAHDVRLRLLLRILLGLRLYPFAPQRTLPAPRLFSRTSQCSGFKSPFLDAVRDWVFTLNYHGYYYQRLLFGIIVV